MAAAITLFQRHGGGIHVVRPGTGVASGTGVPFPLRAGPAARREPAKINFSYAALRWSCMNEASMHYERRVRTAGATPARAFWVALRVLTA
jgi:hypothetical protein